MPIHAPFSAVRDHVTPRPPPDAAVDRVVYGLCQPVVGARTLLVHRELLRAALVPVGVLAAFCAVVAVAGHSTRHVHRFYTTFAVLAPLPSIVFADHYARLAARARVVLGFGPVEPCIEPLRRNIGRAVKQAILIAIALAPISGLLDLVPGVGWLLVQLVAAVWALHWVVVEAFDSARVLRPGETLADLDAAAQRVRLPWFVRGLYHAADRVPFGEGLVRRFARLCDRLSLPWREEVALVEDHPALMLGFALSTAAVLALPVLNLAFRPIVIVGASHVLGQLEAAGAGAGVGHK
ncbi:MAG TPA: hypothetical protein VHT91_14860 [Kofleriaceae bacterium]|jgi:hypothetical protein|nr:hypothetical protein [Kofleriaceae bacterium]